jgi:adenylate kinase family enzyme
MACNISAYDNSRNFAIWGGYPETLKRFLFGASALNYMGIRGEYKITREMLQDEKYFDRLFTKWYENQKK